MEMLKKIIEDQQESMNKRRGSRGNSEDHNKHTQVSEPTESHSLTHCSYATPYPVMAGGHRGRGRGRGGRRDRGGENRPSSMKKTKFDSDEEGDEGKGTFWRSFSPRLISHTLKEMV